MDRRRCRETKLRNPASPARLANLLLQASELLSSLGRWTASVLLQLLGLSFPQMEGARLSSKRLRSVRESESTVSANPLDPLSRTLLYENLLKQTRSPTIYDELETWNEGVRGCQPARSPGGRFPLKALSLLSLQF